MIVSTTMVHDSDSEKDEIVAKRGKVIFGV
jgi:hypothetical protein